MKCLIVEDDLSALRLMQRYLADYAHCDTAMDGEQALTAFRQAVQEKRPYELVCLDIMLPRMDGHTVLQAMRQIETECGINGGAKVIMTTALRDLSSVSDAFSEGCEVYLVKPVERGKLLKELEGLGLIPVKIR